jgi:hypothetical protein
MGNHEEKQGLEFGTSGWLGITDEGFVLCKYSEEIHLTIEEAKAIADYILKKERTVVDEAEVVHMEQKIRKP